MIAWSQLKTAKQTGKQFLLSTVDMLIIAKNWVRYNLQNIKHYIQRGGEKRRGERRGEKRSEGEEGREERRVKERRGERRGEKEGREERRVKERRGERRGEKEGRKGGGKRGE